MSPPNSLLDKAMHGAGLGNDPSPSSLLSRALAAREPVSASPETIETETETETNLDQIDQQIYLKLEEINEKLDGIILFLLAREAARVED